MTMAGPFARKRHARAARAKIALGVIRALFSAGYFKPELAAFEESLQGNVPDWGGKADVILVACDAVYLSKFALPFLQSVESMPGRHSIHVHLLGGDAPAIAMMEDLIAALSNVDMSYTVDPCALAPAFPQRQIYYNAARFLLAPLILHRGARRLLILDVDTIMNNSPWPILDSIRSNRSAFIFRDREKDPCRKILASAVYYCRGAASQTTASACARSMIAAMKGKPSYHIDQIVIWYLNAFGRLREKRQAVDIPANLMSYDYSPSVALWTVKGSAKHQHAFAKRLAAVYADDPHSRDTTTQTTNRRSNPWEGAKGEDAEKIWTAGSGSGLKFR